MMLRLFGDSEGTNNRASLWSLHVVTGLAESTLKVVLPKLEKRQLLKKTPGAGRRPNDYQCVIPQRLLQEISDLLDEANEPTTGLQTEASRPPTGSQGEMPFRSEPTTGPLYEPTTGLQSRSRPIDERSRPTTGPNLDNLEKNNNKEAIAEQGRALYNDYAARHRFHANRTRSEKRSKREEHTVEQI